MPSSGNGLVIFERWNRKLHYYLGLFFLFFLWLFSLTGLLLNHGRWPVAQAANQRTETRYERVVQAPAGTTDLERAEDLMHQLGLVGEIELPTAFQTAGHFDFSVNRPKDASQVKVDLAGMRASVQHFDNGGWAIFRIFHTFSGSRFNQSDSHRDWVVTTAWVVAMDALCTGLIVMVLGSYYMWFRFKRTRLGLGLFALIAGYGCCALFFRAMWE